MQNIKVERMIMNFETILKLSTVVIVVAILIFGVHITYITVATRSDIIKKLNEINTKIDKLSDEVRIRCGTFLD